MAKLLFGLQLHWYLPTRYRRIFHDGHADVRILVKTTSPVRATGTLTGADRLIHSFAFFFYLCGDPTQTRRKRSAPRIMYLPTGQPVIVTPRPIVAGNGEAQPAKLIKLQTATGVLDVDNIPMVAVPAATASPSSPHHLTTARRSINEPFRQGVPPRKPVAGAPVGTHYATPWPSTDYQPDEAERARAVRGERQAQWMTLHGMVLGANGVNEKDNRQHLNEGSSGAGPGIERTSRHRQSI